ncbi:MAG: ABC transporter permease [Defluviitaleaceae bacterium]|nr:ABC transporter permease [Defluviitaleaceae bacterium]
MEQNTISLENKGLEMALSTKPPSLFVLFWRELKHDAFAFISLFVLIFVIVAVYAGAFFLTSTRDVMSNNLINQNQSPQDSGSLLGTDSNGRYVAPLLFVAARNSLNISFAVTGISFIIGLVVGVTSGFYGGKIDNTIMRIVDTWTMIPALMFIIAMISIADQRTVGLFILFLTMFTWMARTRLVRAAALQNCNMDYINASKTLGTRNSVIIFREMLPNLVDIVVANFVLSLAASIGMETGLSLLGFGLGMEVPSLGTMLQAALQPVNLQFRWWTWAPALILVVIIMLCINFVGNALQRVADPKQRYQ